MGNEMPNRNIQAGPEDDNMQNQTSQKSSSDDVAAPIEEKMPKSMPVEISEDDSDPGSKKEAITNKDSMDLKVKTSAVDGDQQVQGKNSEESTQKSAISHEGDAARMFDDKIIEPQKLILSAEESIKRQEGSSTNEEMLPNDTEYNCNKDGNITPTKLEIASMQVEDKHFDESIKISLAELKQPCPETESIINDNQTEIDVSIPNQMSVNENILPTLVNASESTGKLTDISSNNAKSEVGAEEDTNLGYNEDKQAVDEVSLQSGTQKPLVMSLPSEDIQKTPSSQASLDHTGVKIIQNNPVMALQTLSQQHGLEEKSMEDKIFSATDLCSTRVESTKLPNGFQTFTEVKRDAIPIDVQQKIISTEENGLKEPVKQPSGASNILNEMKEDNISAENAKINRSQASNGFLHDENIKAIEEILTSELGEPEIPTVVPSEKSEPEKQEVDITAVEVMEKNVNPQSALELLEENNSFQINSSEVNNRILKDENIEVKEDKISTELGKPETPTVVPLEKSEPEKREVDITAVEVIEKTVNPESTLESPEENDLLILHQGIEYKNNNVPEVEIGGLKVPNCLQSELEPIQGNQDTTETILAVDAIQESLSLLPPPEHIDTSDLTLLRELKVGVSSEGDSNVVDKLEKPTFEQFADQCLQNDHDKAGERDIADGTMDGTPHFESIDKINMVQLVNIKDKPSSTSATVSANEVSQLTEILVPESSASMYTIEVEGQDFNIPNKAENINTINFEKKEKALQSQNDWHTEERLNGMTGKDERNIMEPEFDKLNEYKDSLSSSEFTSNKTEVKSDHTLQNSFSPIKVDSPQEQEDISKASNNKMQKQDVIGVDTKNKSAENGMLSILDKETPTWPAANITSTASALDEQPPDMYKEHPIQQGDKSKHTTTSNSELYSSVFVSCPTLESWHEESEDDPKTPLLATAPGSPEEKKELRLQDNLEMDDPRVSLERTDSEKIRTPLRHLFKDDSTVAVPEQIVVPIDQVIAKEKSVKDIWGSPAKLVSTPPSKEKQKTKSIFSQCICCSAVQ